MRAWISLSGGLGRGAVCMCLMRWHKCRRPQHLSAGYWRNARPSVLPVVVGMSVLNCTSAIHTRVQLIKSPDLQLGWNRAWKEGFGMWPQMDDHGGPLCGHEKKRSKKEGSQRGQKEREKRTFNGQRACWFARTSRAPF